MADGLPWAEGLWARRAALASIPTALVWGMRDLAFGPPYLARWRATLPDARVLELPTAGHLVQEEAPTELLGAIRRLLAASPA